MQFQRFDYQALTAELLYGLFFVLVAAGIVTWLIRRTGRENEIIRGWWTEKQRIRQMMREIREEDEYNSRFMKHEQKTKTMKPSCAGTGCPKTGSCARFKADIDPKKDMYLSRAPYNHLTKKCEFYLGTAPGDTWSTLNRILNGGEGAPFNP